MTPTELRRSLREQRKQLRRSLPALRRQARARVDQLPAVRQARTRRRIRRAIGATLLLVLLCLIRCDCESAPPPAPARLEPAPAPVVKPKVVVLKPVKRKPLTASMDAQPRPQINGEARAPPTWIDEFRLALGHAEQIGVEHVEVVQRVGHLDEARVIELCFGASRGRHLRACQDTA